MVDYALSGCLTAVCAVWFSTYIPNPFAALAAPMAIYYTLIRINFLTNINGWLRNSSFGFLSPVYWINVTHPTTSPAYQLGIKFSTVLVLCLLMGVATICQIKRRVKHGQLS